MWTQGEYIATLWAAIAITLIFVVIRVYVRLTSVNRPWREILVVLAWILFLLYGVGETYLFYRYQVFNEMMYSDDTTSYMSNSDLEGYYKVFFALDFSYPQALNFCKAVLLLTFQDLCPRRLFPKIWGLIMVTWFILLSHQVGIFFIYEFVQCFPDPISTLWNPNKNCVGRYPGFLITEWSVALSTDLLCYIIPIFIVWQLRNLTIIQRIGVASMFCIGFVHAAFTAWYIFETTSPKEVTQAATGRVEFVQILIPASAIIVVCIPQIRLLGRWKFVKSIALSMSTTIHEIGSKRGLKASSTRTTVTKVDVTDGGKDKLVDEEKAIPAAVQTEDLRSTDLESPRMPEPVAQHGGLPLDNRR